MFKERCDKNVECVARAHQYISSTETTLAITAIYYVYNQTTVHRSPSFIIPLWQQLQ